LITNFFKVTWTNKKWYITTRKLFWKKLSAFWLPS